MSRLTLRRLSYYIAVIGFGILAHQGSIAALLGDGLTDFVRRNSEAYALAVLVPASWDLFAWNADPADPSPPSPVRRGGQYAWLGFLAVGALVLQSSSLASALGLPQSIITLGEAFVAALVVAVYQGWSRGWLGVVPDLRPLQRGSRWYYLGVILFTILAYQDFVARLVGPTVIDWLQINAEAYAAMLLIPAYFDFVAPSRHRWVPWAWYAVLIVVPLAVASGRLDGTAVGSVTMWLARTTEAFLAALAISIYFSWWRSGSRRQHASAPEVGDGIA